MHVEGLEIQESAVLGAQGAILRPASQIPPSLGSPVPHRNIAKKRFCINHKEARAIFRGTRRLSDSARLQAHLTNPYILRNDYSPSTRSIATIATGFVDSRNHLRTASNTSKSRSICLLITHKHRKALHKLHLAQTTSP